MELEGKILSLPELLAERERLRKAGKKLVFTNGCFDLSVSYTHLKLPTICSV